MSYITTKEAALRWGITEEMVRKYCRQGRIALAEQRGKSWWVPQDAQKPQKQVAETPQLPPLAKRLSKEKTKRIYHGLYDYIQINLCYSSGRMASNRLMLKQVEEIFKTGKVRTGFEPIKVDDLIEALNHFASVNLIIETATTPLTQGYIKNLHAMLGYGTMAQRKGKLHPSEYRTEPCKLTGTKTTPPKNINSQMAALLTDYERLNKVELMQIADLHVRFEKIHPFEDCNGRVGRLLMLKECLRHEVMPFIIDDKHRAQYLKGIKGWEYDKSMLLSTFHDAQQRFAAQLDLQELHRYAQHYKPFMEV